MGAVSGTTEQEGPAGLYCGCLGTPNVGSFMRLRPLRGPQACCMAWARDVVTCSLLDLLLGYSRHPCEATPLSSATWPSVFLVPWAALPHQDICQVVLTGPPNSSSGPFPVSVQSQADPSSSRHGDLSSAGDRPEASAAPDTNHLWLVSEGAAPSRVAGVGASQVLSFTCAQHKAPRVASATLSGCGWPMPEPRLGRWVSAAPCWAPPALRPLEGKNLAKGSPSSVLSTQERPCALKASWWDQGALSWGETVSTQPQRC